MQQDNNTYENNEEFNLSLDEEGDVIIIAGNEFKRSVILYELDPDLYVEALLDFRTKRLDALKQIIYDDFPACIAFNFRLSERGEGSIDPVRKLLHLKDTWESVIFALYALVLAEVRRKNIDLRNATYTQGEASRSFSLNRIFTDSLKQKIENIRGVVNHCQANEIDLKCGRFIDNEILDTLADLQDIRNDLSHHTAPTREQAEVEINQVLPLLEKLLPKIEFLKSCLILRFDRHDARTWFGKFNGHSLNREVGQFELQAELLAYVLANQSDLFVYWDDEIMSLSPFMHYIPDATGHESYLCFYKGRRNGNYFFEPIKLREEVTFDPLLPKFESEREALQRLFVP